MSDLLALLAEEIDPTALTASALIERRRELAQSARAYADDRRDELTPADLAVLQSAKAACDALTTEATARTEHAAQLTEGANSILAELEPAEPDDAALVAGSRGSSNVAREPVTVPKRCRPRVPETRDVVLVAAGSPDGSARFESETHLVEALFNAAETMRRSRGVDGDRTLIASVSWEHAYDGRPTVSCNRSAPDNGAVLVRAAEEFTRRARERNALVASGGVPGPPEARYDVPTFGTAARPLRDALPMVLSTRGQLTYNMAPTTEDILVDTTGGAIGAMTSAQDAAAVTKTVQEIGAPTAKTATVEANYLRLQQSNFADRFVPEFSSAWMRNAQVRYARHAEARRFADIAAASTHMTNAPAHFGAWRDLKRALLGLTEELEDRLRDPELPITCILPEYVPALCAADLTAQAPGDQTFDITEDMVRARLNALDPHLNVVFVYDGTQTGQRLLTTPTGQSPRTPGFDADVDLLIFPTGTWAFLDGGTLDLGIVRDSTLNQSNRFQTFFEQWECVAQLAPFSYHATISLCADGNSQAPQNVAVCSPQGS